MRIRGMGDTLSHFRRDGRAKRAYTRADAYLAAEAHNKRPYECPLCKAWHIGGPPPGNRQRAEIVAEARRIRQQAEAPTPRATPAPRWVPPGTVPRPIPRTPPPCHQPTETPT